MDFKSRENIYKQAIQEYKDLYFQKYRINLSLENATVEAMSFLNGMTILLRDARQMAEEQIK